MADSEQLGIVGIHSYDYFVRQSDRSRAFYEDRFGWTALARSSDAKRADEGSHMTVYGAGDIRVRVITPDRDDSQAARYLQRHPAGIGALNFEVRDAAAAWAFLEGRGATCVHSLRESETGDGGAWRWFTIATPLGEVIYRFVERVDTDVDGSRLERIDGAVAANPNGFVRIDHVTSNALTMAPVILWMEKVLGLEECWRIQFHTTDYLQRADAGTGLRSIVMWDPASGLKFPTNEPLAPFFEQSQITAFVDHNRGAGIQHMALEVTDILGAVRNLRHSGVEFLHTPGNYYDHAPERLAARGVDASAIGHALDDLRETGILIDGSPTNNYLVQIFLQEAANLYGESDAGPFFYELIERCGDDGFGEGNFKALFEAIERDQGIGA